MSQSSGSDGLAMAIDNPGWAESELDRASRVGLWALPVWTVLLLPGTLTHQTDTRTDFAAFAGYVRTTEFLLGHIVYSIVGAAIGVLGFLALFVFVALHREEYLGAPDDPEAMDRARDLVADGWELLSVRFREGRWLFRRQGSRIERRANKEA